MDNGIEVFLKTNDEGAVIYFMAGIIEEKNNTQNFSGVIYAHSGGGDFNKEIVFENKLMPFMDENGNGDFWCDKDNERHTSLLTDYPTLFEEILLENKGLNYDYNSEALFVSNLLKSGLDKFNCISTNKFKEGLITPFDYGNTSFDNPLKRWTSVEIDDLTNKKTLANLQFEKNFNSCLECHKAIENKEVKAINAVAEYITVYPETPPRKLINAVNENLGVEFDTYDIEVIATVETLVMDGELKHTISNNDFSMDYYYKTMNDYLDEDTQKETEKGKKVNKDR